MAPLDDTLYGRHWPGELHSAVRRAGVRRLAEDARASAAWGSPRCGATAPRHLADRVERETALTVFKASGPGRRTTPREAAPTPSSRTCDAANARRPAPS